ncbi:aldo/keto reductase [Streptomyces sp. 900105755]
MTFDGGDVFGSVGETDLAGGRRQVDMCLDAGVNLVDTGNVYSAGAVEEILGQAIAGRRNRLLISSKVRTAMGSGPNDEGLSRHHLLGQIEASLRRLNTDHAYRQNTGRISLHELPGRDAGFVRVAVRPLAGRRRIRRPRRREEQATAPRTLRGQPFSSIQPPAACY